MSKVIQFLDTLKKEFPNMFEIKEGAPMPEFWESFDAAYQEAVEHQMHPTAFGVCPHGVNLGNQACIVCEPEKFGVG